MSRRAVDDLKNELIKIREIKSKEKKVFISLELHKYKKFLAAVVLSNKKNEEMEETYKRIVNSMIDDFIEKVDFYDLTEEDIESIADIFDEIV